MQADIGLLPNIQANVALKYVKKWEILALLHHDACTIIYTLLVILYIIIGIGQVTI